MVVSSVVTISEIALKRAIGALYVVAPNQKGYDHERPWIAVFAVIGIALGMLAITSQGELPYVQTDQVHTAPAWG